MRLNEFRVRCFQPLSHLSAMKAKALVERAYVTGAYVTKAL